MNIFTIYFAMKIKVEKDHIRVRLNARQLQAIIRGLSDLCQLYSVLFKQLSYLLYLHTYRIQHSYPSINGCDLRVSKARCVFEMGSVVLRLPTVNPTESPTTRATPTIAAIPIANNCSFVSAIVQFKTQLIDLSFLQTMITLTCPFL